MLLFWKLKKKKRACSDGRGLQRQSGCLCKDKCLFAVVVGVARGRVAFFSSCRELCIFEVGDLRKSGENGPMWRTASQNEGGRAGGTRRVNFFFKQRKSPAVVKVADQ